MIYVLDSAQGVCKAGKKLALDDERTGLIVKVFELIDCTAVCASRV